MADFKFDFANPSGHADWTRYAGFDRKTGGFAPPASSYTPSAVKPPENLQQMWQQETQPISNAYNSVKQAADQIGSGNFKDAFNTVVNSGAQVPTSAQPQQPALPQQIPQPIGSPYNYESQLETSMLPTSGGTEFASLFGDGLDLMMAMG
jgi:hypothetical protein